MERRTGMRDESIVFFETILKSHILQFTMVFVGLFVEIYLSCCMESMNNVCVGTRDPAAFESLSVGWTVEQTALLLMQKSLYPTTGTI